MDFASSNHGKKKSKLTLSAKEYTKIAGTIASVRRHHQLDNDDDLGPYNVEEPSFIAETSFVKAPLNSRIGTTNPVTSKSKGKERCEPLHNIPLEIQEALILDDLLFVLTGIEGTYITYHPDFVEEEDPLQGAKFEVSAGLDPSLRDLTERILPLATYYTAICAFVEARSHLDYGLVNHALCASMRDMLKDYQTLLSQLEHAFNSSPNFSLQKLWFYVHPTSHTLSLLYALVCELNPSLPIDADEDDDEEEEEEDPEERARNEALGLGSTQLKALLKTSNKETTTSLATIPMIGGEVLCLLHGLASRLSGDPVARDLFGELMNKASRPYVRIVCRWVGTGKLEDKWEEVCIKEKSWVHRRGLEVEYEDGYWESRYTLRDGSSTSKQDSHQHALSVPPPRTPGGRLPGGACVPPPLERWKHKILLAGKYLNVIRECGIEMSQEGAEDEKGAQNWGMDDESFHTYLTQAYSKANTALLSLLLDTQHLIPRLRALKRYFFLAQSSFLTHYLDLAAGELRKSVRHVSVVRLQSLLEMALREGGGGASPPEGGATTAARDGEEFKEDLKVTMATSGLYEWLIKVASVSGVIGQEGGDAVAIDAPPEKDDKEKKPLLGIDTLTLDYSVPFPVSLVLSRKMILRYQLIFRFLLHLKYVEQSLCAMFVDHTTAPWRVPVDSPTPSTHRAPTPSATSPNPAEFSPTSAVPSSRGPGSFYQWRLRLFLLRAKMLSWIQSILAFATFEVLEPNWRKLEERLGKVRTVDDLLREHTDSLDTCLKECMLTSKKMLTAYSKLIVTCSTFALYTSQLNKSAKEALATIDASGSAQGMSKRWHILSKFESNFDHWFKVHLDCVQYYASSENVSLLPLVVRLNSVKGQK